MEQDTAATDLFRPEADLLYVRKLTMDVGQS